MPKPHNGIARPCLLLRVSTDEQDMTQQEREAREYCRSTYGVELAESAVYREHGISGSKNSFEQRDALKRAVEACERGEYTHFIVHKLDRSARSLRVFTEVWDRLARAGVAFVAIIEGIDSSRGDSTMTAQILAVTSEFFSRNLSREIKKGQKGRTNAGKSNGKPPYGYRANGKDWITDTREIDGHSGMTRVELVRRIFCDAAAGWSATEIASKLNREGYIMESVRHGIGPFRRNTIRQLLSCRLYLGEVQSIPDDQGHRSWRPGVHEAIIEVDLFQRAQAGLAEHALHPRTAPPMSYHWIFTGGILKCADCRDRGTIRCVSYNITKICRDASSTYLMCANKKHSHLCQAPNVREDVIALQLGEYLERWQADPGMIDEAIARYQQQRLSSDQAAVAIGQRHHIQARLERLGERYEWEDISKEDYLRRRTELREQLLAITVNEPQQIDEETIMQLAATMRHIRTAWDMASNKQKSELVRLLFRAIWIRDRKIESVEPQPQYRVFFGEGLI